GREAVPKARRSGKCHPRRFPARTEPRQSRSARCACPRDGESEWQARKCRVRSHAWRAEAAGDRACARHAAEDPVSRRTDGRAQSHGGRARLRPGQGDPRHRRHGHPGRASHEGDHAHRRSSDRAASRREDRRCGAEGDRAASRRDQSLSRRESGLMLKVEHLQVAYGKVQTLWDISFEVRRGEIVALIGANGAGKKTKPKTLSALLPPRAGAITLDGDSLAECSSIEIVERGIVHVPEGRGLFPEMTVLDNLLMGAYSRRKAGRSERLDKVYAIFPILKERGK